MSCIEVPRPVCGAAPPRWHIIRPISAYRHDPLPSQSDTTGTSKTRCTTRVTSPSRKIDPASVTTQVSSLDCAASPTMCCAEIKPAPSIRTDTLPLSPDSIPSPSGASVESVEQPWERCADRLRACGFTTVDALRARPSSPRVFFLMDAPTDIRARAEKIASNWQGWITWHPDRTMAGRGHVSPASDAATASVRPGGRMASLSALKAQREPRRTKGITTQVGYINRNHQEVIRATSSYSIHRSQLVYVPAVPKVWTPVTGAYGCDIFQRRCPAHDGGASGLEF